MNIEERRQEYKICQEHGHKPSDQVLASYPPKNVCKFCGTYFWFETTTREQNIP